MIDLINVGILSYNRPKLLMESVESLEKSGLKANQIYILDNGSDISKMASIKKKLGSRVIWLGLEKNIGYASNFSRLFKISNAKYLMALHDDDIILEKTLITQLSILENNEIDILSCNGYVLDENSRLLKKKILRDYYSKDLIFFNNSTEIASHIMNDSCVPFSPIIFRNSTTRDYALKMKDYEDQFKQTLDAAFLHDLSDKLKIVLNMKPLYGCRVHSGQDSNLMDDFYNKKLIKHFYYKSKGSEIEINNLKKKIKKVYTSNLIVELIKYLISLKFDFAIKKYRSSIKEFLTLKFIGLFIYKNFYERFKNK